MLVLLLSAITTLFRIFVEEFIYIPLAVEHNQRVILFAISRLDTLGCIFAEGGFKFGVTLCFLPFQLGKTSFYSSNILFDNGNSGIIPTVQMIQQDRFFGFQLLNILGQLCNLCI